MNRYRASMQGNDINLNLGYSHPVVLTPPEGVSVKVEGNVNITVSGYDKEQVIRKSELVFLVDMYRSS